MFLRGLRSRGREVLGGDNLDDLSNNGDGSGDGSSLDVGAQAGAAVLEVVVGAAGSVGRDGVGRDSDGGGGGSNGGDDGAGGASVSGRYSDFAFRLIHLRQGRSQNLA
jgi:hypothetical protein